MEIIKAEEQKETRLKESKQRLRDLWDTIKQTNVYTLWEAQKEKREKKEQRERIFEKTKAENFHI